LERFIKVQGINSIGGMNMPYIVNDRRKKYANEIESIVNQMNLLPEATSGHYPAGDLNYIITELIVQTLSRQGIRYQNVNAIVGALECCKLELYRRLIAPYEDEKIDSNGDVY